MFARPLVASVAPLELGCDERSTQANIQRVENPHRDCRVVVTPENSNVPGATGAASARHQHSIGTASAQHRHSIGADSAQHRRSIGAASVPHRRSIGAASAQHRRNSRSTGALRLRLKWQYCRLLLVLAGARTRYATAVGEPHHICVCQRF